MAGHHDHSGAKAREVTERDLRAPQFADGSPDDYEFSGDGKIVRKDRWERAIRSIRSSLGDARREWEVGDVVAAVAALVASLEPSPADEEVPQ